MIKSVLLIFGLALGDNAQAKDNPCDEDWTFDGVDGCWSVIKNNVNFNDAKNACTAKGATLGVPNDLIVDTVYRGNNMVWIGAEKNGGKFVHSENSGKDLKADWYDGQPDNFGSNENCVELSNVGYLKGFKFGPGYNDVDCNTKRETLCKKPCVGCKKKNSCPSGWTEQYWKDSKESTCIEIIKEEKETLRNYHLCIIFDDI